MKAALARGGKFILIQPITRLIGETVEATFARKGIDPSRLTEITKPTRRTAGSSGLSSSTSTTLTPTASMRYVPARPHGWLLWN